MRRLLQTSVKQRRALSCTAVARQNSQPLEAFKQADFATFADAGLGTLNRSGFDQIFPTGIIEHFYEAVIQTNGLDWLVGVPLVTLAVRLCVIPFQINNQIQLSKASTISTQHQMKLREKQVFCLDAQSSQKIEMEIAQEKMNAMNPMKMLKRMIPTMIAQSSHFLALKSIADSGLHSINTTHLPWAEFREVHGEIVSLASTDPLWILPMSASVITAFTIMNGMDENMAGLETAKSKDMIKKMAYVMSGFIVVFVGFQSSTIGLYMTTNALISVAVGTVMKQEGVRKSLGIYKTKEQLEIEMKFNRLEMERAMEQMRASQQLKESTETYEKLAKQKINDRSGDWK